MKRFLLVILAGLIPVAGAAETSAGDTAAVAKKTSTLHLTPLEIAAITGGGIVLAAVFDKKIHEHYAPMSNSKLAVDFRKAGDIGQLAGPIVGTVFLIQGAAASNSKSHETGVLLYEGFLLSGATTGVAKYIIGRKRPSKTDESLSFKPLGGDVSFPSGHTTTAFSAATVLSEQYPHWWVVIPAFGAASAVGFSRLYANQHWLSDVVAGAAVGISTSHLLRNHRRENGHTGDSALIYDGEKLSWVKRF